MQCVLGVDGGNTKTIALVAALDGTILGAGRGGCGDIYNARAGGDWSDSAVAAIANIEYAVVSALQAAQVKASDIVTGVFNMAGADWPEDFALLQGAMEARDFGRRILVQNDALGVLHAGSSDNTGVSVVCGTGFRLRQIASARSTISRAPGRRVRYASEASEPRHSASISWSSTASKWPCASRRRRVAGSTWLRLRCAWARWNRIRPSR